MSGGTRDERKAFFDPSCCRQVPYLLFPHVG